VAYKAGGLRPRLKKFRANSVFQGKRKLLKILNAKSIFNTVKNSGQTVFQGKSKLFKILNDKKYIQYSEKFQGNSIFQASASCSKVLNDKKYIFNTVDSGHTLFFRASASCSKILKVYSMFNTVKNFRANSVFQGKRRVAQKC